MARTADLDYHLPPGLIATTPADPRDSCRMMVVSRSDPGRVDHLRFRDLPSVLGAGDLLVRNTSRVAPARIAGVRPETGARLEGLFVEDRGDRVWSVLLKANTRLRTGLVIALDSAAGGASEWGLELIERDGDGWVARVVGPEGHSTTAVLEAVGATPIPPYIRAARKAAGDETPDAKDREWYQTVYAAAVNRHGASVAAPTAGLHFTPGLIDAVTAKGVEWADVTLHVGIGTFKPIETETVEEHPIHAEWAEVGAGVIRAMRAARARGGRVVAVGTTSVRAVETVANPPSPEAERDGYAGMTTEFILPGREMRWTDALITNFHLPRSTLLALVGALFPGGVARVKELYREAIDKEYRFYSYGDAMVILP